MPSAAESYPHRSSEAPCRARQSLSNPDSRFRVASSRWLEARWRSGGPQPGEWLLHRGDSMAPALRDGDQVFVQSLAGASPPEAGEIIVFRRSGRLIAHRLVAVGEGFVITRGDASPGDDPPLLPDRLLGRVTRVRHSPAPVRWARRLQSYLSHLRRR